MNSAIAPRPDTRPDAGIVLRVEHLSKHYAGVTALADVSLAIAAGSIHGLLGENGAGKSTLVGMICGQISPTGGTIYWQGQALGEMDVSAMEQAGVFLVTQEPMIIAQFSAAENLMLGIWPQTRWGRVNWRKLKADATRILQDSGIDPNALAGGLDAVSRRKLNILRAMFSGGRLIILDEPTASLTQEDRRQLFTFMRRLQGEGVTFVFISHFNDEILEICDAVSVLRDGRHVGSYDNIQNLISEQLTELVLGRGLSVFQRVHPEFTQAAPPGVTLTNIRNQILDVPELTLTQGEVLGITGLPGGGGKELARALFGLDHASGSIRLALDDEHALPKHPAQAFAMGIAWLSDDRRRDGAIAQMSIAHNISLSALIAMAKNRWIDAHEENTLSQRYFSELEIKASESTAAVDTLSGGNQQKVCLARVLATQPRLLILDEPTRGIDVGVKQEVLRIVNDLSQRGVAVILISTDTDELVRAVDRVLIFQGGRIHRELSGPTLTQSALRQV